MMKWLLLLLPLVAFADSYDLNDRNLNAKLQPFYPSPYIDRGWSYGSDCTWDHARWDKDFIVGTCRYSPNAQAATSKGAQGWAEVHWRKSDLAPFSATPCSIKERPPGLRHCPFSLLQNIPHDDKID